MMSKPLVGRECLRVLVVDDHPIFRLGLKSFLQGGDRQVEIFETESGQDAVSQVARFQPDIVLLDVALPDMTGFEASAKILEKAPESRIIFLSINKDPELVEEAFRVGGRDYLSKDEAPDRLLHSIRTVLASPVPRTGLLGRDTQKQGAREPLGEGLLTARQREVLRRIARGSSNQEIAAALDISIRTVEQHRKHLMEKLGVNSSSQLVRRAIQLGLDER